MSEVLDMTAGSRMMWFDKSDPRATFIDARAESHVLCDGRAPTIDEIRLRELLKNACDVNWDDGLERISRSPNAGKYEKALIDYVMGRS